MVNEGILFTVVYPQAFQFFHNFCSSISNQTRKDFDLLVVNDGCKAKELEKELVGLKYTIVDAVGSPSENRAQGINYAREKKYKYIVFCDADDTFLPERYEKTLNEFQVSGADIIVGNLNIVDKDLVVLIHDYFSLEIPSNRWVEVGFIEDKNIFGMSNTALRLAALKEDVILPETPIADWYLFTLLLSKGLRAKYVSESYVNYRQYDSNMIGINRFDAQSFRRLAKLKNNHYGLLVRNGYAQYEHALIESGKLLEISDSEIEIIVRNQLLVHKQPLWWQIITK